jgi:hypothetical protein
MPDDIDFTLMPPAQTLVVLADAADWLARQWRNARATIPPEVALGRLDRPGADWAWKAGEETLPQLARITRGMVSMPVIEPPVVPPPETE